jgi:hypothetical protein
VFLLPRAWKLMIIQIDLKREIIPTGQLTPEPVSIID